MTNMQRYFEKKLEKKISEKHYNVHSVIPSRDKDY